VKRKVKDVMTTTVVVVAQDTPFKEIARRLAEHRVAALPVVDARDRAVGIVSEADLLVKEELADPPRRRFRRERRGTDRRKAEGTLAREVMSSPAVTIGPEAPLADAARLMHRRGFRSLPVVDEDGRVIGIVARRDLLQAFLRPDADIRREVEEEILHRSLWLPEGSVRVEVTEGVVSLNGTVDRATVVPILVRMVEGTDGVVRVHHRLSFEFDDAEVRPYVPVPWGVVPQGRR